MKLPGMLKSFVFALCLPLVAVSHGQAQSIPTFTSCYAQASPEGGLFVEIYCTVTDQNGDDINGGWINATVYFNYEPYQYCDAPVTYGFASCNYWDSAGAGNYSMTVDFGGYDEYLSSSYSGPIYVYEE